jgi:hypothetical protein
MCERGVQGAAAVSYLSLSSSPPARLSSMYLSVVRGGGGGGGGGRVASLLGHSPLLVGHRPVC